MDFTVKTYKDILGTLNDKGFCFLTFAESLLSQKSKSIVLRHDVDSLPANSLHFARIQADMGIRGSYYFRIVPQSFDENVIEQIASFGHEIGYHYEDVGKIAQSDKRLKTEEEIVKIAIESFLVNYNILRNIAPVNSICMHGSPMSRWDSRLLWKYYDYHDFGIIGEPYFDMNFDEVIYLTDTGRRWDGGRVSIRDKGVRPSDKNLREDAYIEWKVKPMKGSLMNMSQEAIDFQNRYKFRSTFDIINTVKSGELNDRMMITFHPQRWTNKLGCWVKELVSQNLKNVAKYFLVKWK